jgi:hypothetical protein
MIIHVAEAVVTNCTSGGEHESALGSGGTRKFTMLPSNWVLGEGGFLVVICLSIFGYLLVLNYFSSRYRPYCPSLWPRGLKHERFSLARTLGSWVRIPLKAWTSACVYSIYVVLCVGRGLATG